ncbi:MULTISPECIES: hypothetical protein [unclassified Acinetobacter]|uniref:hypothetical protein n=1 Tax=unclassified Acinetobacter TaxID=196816 RepID=UPI002574AF19|nr:MULTISPECIES: hypothetical protein [unclassified Acinetobacter]MDM1763964.1 hypothetical protein [Acinetobacter sp. 226-1]MDM1767698.1 hypothetical protein [Acinetobacter sp. 226-4]
MQKNTIYQIFNFQAEGNYFYQLIRTKGFDKEKGIKFNPFIKEEYDYKSEVVMYSHDDFDIYPSFDLIRFDKIRCLIRIYSLRFGESYILDHQFLYVDALDILNRFGNECFETVTKLLIRKYGVKPDEYWTDE